LQLTSAANVHLDYVIGGVLPGSSVSDSVSTLNVAFEGQNTTELRSDLTVTYTGIPPASSTTRVYLRLDGTDILTYGSTGGVTTPVATSFKSVNTPPARDKRYSLAVGETATQTYSATTTTMIAGQPSNTQTTTQTDTVRYLGRETVTVLAGTFDTCKFEGNTVLLWQIAGGSSAGITVKSATSSGSTLSTVELRSGTINGSAIRP
jgi:hypothetical protein